MRSTIVLALAFVTMLSSGCGMFSLGSRRARPATPEPAPAFTNRVWRVVDGPEVGTLHVFLSDNSWLITPAGAASPTLGRWHYAGGGLVLIEGGYRVPADILEQGQERFVIRVHRPAGAADIAMVPARDVSF